jgi:drug/metabolite transporter (DMT)-like permease
MRLSPHSRALGQGLFVTFLWATSWVLIKIGLQEIPPLTFAGLRYGLAALLLLPLAARRGHLAPLQHAPRRLWLGLALLGLVYYTLTQGAMFVTLAYLPAITTNLIMSFSTALVALLAGLSLGERTLPGQWGGIALAALGAFIFFYPVPAGGAPLIGIAAALIALGANVTSSLLGRGVNRSEQLHPLAVTAVTMSFGACLLLLAGVLTQGLPEIGLTGWLIIAWLAVVNTAFAFTLWNHTLRTLSAVESSMINGTMMIHIPILAVVFLGETLTWRSVAGLALVGIGTVIVQWRRRGQP